MQKQLADERLKKIQAVNKLAEIMNRKEFSGKQSKKVSATELRRKEKDCRKLQQELTTVRPFRPTTEPRIVFYEHLVEESFLWFSCYSHADGMHLELVIQSLSLRSLYSSWKVMEFQIQNPNKESHGK